MSDATKASVYRKEHTHAEPADFEIYSGGPGELFCRVVLNTDARRVDGMAWLLAYFVSAVAFTLDLEEHMTYRAFMLQFSQALVFVEAQNANDKRRRAAAHSEPLAVAVARGAMRK